MSETVLWTNPSPTSDFAGQAVTLSESMLNYKYLKFRWKNTKSSTSESLNGSMIIPVDDFDHSVGSTYYAFPVMGGSGSNTICVRNIYKISDTQIQIATCKQWNSSNNVNANCIPLEIVGLKFA